MAPHPLPCHNQTMTDRRTATKSPVLARASVVVGLVAFAMAILANQWWVVAIAVLAVIIGVVGANRNPSTKSTATVGVIFGAIASGIIFFL